MKIALTLMSTFFTLVYSYFYKKGYQQIAPKSQIAQCNFGVGPVYYENRQIVNETTIIFWETNELILSDYYTFSITCSKNAVQQKNNFMALIVGDWSSKLSQQIIVLNFIGDSFDQQQVYSIKHNESELFVEGITIQNNSLNAIYTNRVSLKNEMINYRLLQTQAEQQNHVYLDERFCSSVFDKELNLGVYCPRSQNFSIFLKSDNYQKPTWVKIQLSEECNQKAGSWNFGKIVSEPIQTKEIRMGKAKQRGSRFTMNFYSTNYNCLIQKQLVFYGQNYESFIIRAAEQINSDQFISCGQRRFYQYSQYSRAIINQDISYKIYPDIGIDQQIQQIFCFQQKSAITFLPKNVVFYVKSQQTYGWTYIDYYEQTHVLLCILFWFGCAVTLLICLFCCVYYTDSQTTDDLTQSLQK